MNIKSLLFSADETAAGDDDGRALEKVNTWMDELAVRYLEENRQQFRARSRGPETLLEILKAQSSNHDRLTFGCPIIDNFFEGGLLNQGIIEISGAASCGKTQLCLQLLLTAQLPKSLNGFGGMSLYVCTEGPAPQTRLKQMANSISARFGQQSGDALCDNILIKSISGIDQLFFLLSDSIPKLLKTHPVRLIVLDSIAALFRYEYSKEEAAQRSVLLFRHAQEMRRLCAQFNLPVVVTNQVTATILSQEQQLFSGASATGANAKPSLGLAWASCLTQRIFLHRTNVGSSLGARYMSIKFSPHLNRAPHDTLEYVVDQNGVHGMA